MRIEKHRNTSSLTTNISAAVPESFLADSVQRIFWESNTTKLNTGNEMASIYDQICFEPQICFNNTLSCDTAK